MKTRSVMQQAEQNVAERTYEEHMDLMRRQKIKQRLTAILLLITMTALAFVSGILDSFLGSMLGVATLWLVFRLFVKRNF